MSDTPANPVSQTDADDAELRAFERAQDRFEESAKPGHLQFFVRHWPALMILPNKKIVVPLVRLYISDTQGNMLWDHQVALSGLIDLLDELSKVLRIESKRLGELQFDVDQPADGAELRRLLQRVRENVDVSMESLKTLNIISLLDVVEDEEAQTTEASDPSAGS